MLTSPNFWRGTRNRSSATSYLLPQAVAEADGVCRRRSD